MLCKVEELSLNPNNNETRYKPPNVAARVGVDPLTVWF